MRSNDYHDAQRIRERLPRRLEVDGGSGGQARQCSGNRSTAGPSGARSALGRWCEAAHCHAPQVALAVQVRHDGTWFDGYNTPNLLLSPCSALVAQPKPNIVFLVADDLGGSDLHCYGHPYSRKPRLTDSRRTAHASLNTTPTGATCCPTRTGNAVCAATGTCAGPESRPQAGWTSSPC